MYLKTKYRSLFGKLAISLAYTFSFTLLLVSASVLGYFLSILVLALIPLVTLGISGFYLLKPSNDNILLEAENIKEKTSNVISIDTYINKHNYQKDIGITNYEQPITA